MKKCLGCLTLLLCFHMSTVSASEIKSPSIQIQESDQEQIQPLSRGRGGSYRSPSGSFSGGNRATPGNGYTTGPRSPSSNVTRNPRNQPGQQANPTSRWGGFLGGLATGAIIGHLLNPFGFGGGGGGFSLIGILFWGVIIYFGYRWFKKFREKNR
ncbi:hypothetical protein OB236_37550 [Paenibacillus sp. WQ 127069]|uniref:Uncharacterized protein n=1 Tax=Paenibacillus baimaensis TaxID=2982185 RepID=A0ABT2UVZ2_9BACL|nr:hypothetical protein [Paenibacillus sp. WQ 127069]MCU6797844.1 hypothetical protein [Paenibacillus sp. WQ 127069]